MKTPFPETVPWATLRKPQVMELILLPEAYPVQRHKMKKSNPVFFLFLGICNNQVLPFKLLQ